ncbi:probable inactive purple acid phosphatase 29 isoform X2 [Salvia splendens]|uniref:probable inactive purple acid phosphatase 29 isoform X2 n=1 Tax=Salvia splendens TaxID=180675 RepID=UPI001C278DFA|nr:probable inactive purple acid phosphatase 29 isoform X2 [Salvia splendens]
MDGCSYMPSANKLFPKSLALVPFPLTPLLPMAAPKAMGALALLVVMAFLSRGSSAVGRQLKFNAKQGEFKILQVADMHFGDGKRTACLDVLPRQAPSCSDLNTTAFIRRMILAERPNLIVFTGDNIFGFDASDAVKSMNQAFGPAVNTGIPWAAVLGNHDQESTLSREGVMTHIVGMKNTLSQLNSGGSHVDGFGNYNLEVHGAEFSRMENKSVLNLYMLDSGDYSTVPSIPGYGWIKPSQQLWFQHTSGRLQRQSPRIRPPLRDFALHSSIGKLWHHLRLLLVGLRVVLRILLYCIFRDNTSLITYGQEFHPNTYAADDMKE